jgi:phage N-6-adenine-methyltransferase
LVNTAVLFSSAKDDWETPPALWAALNREFGFSWDVAANSRNYKGARGCFFGPGSEFGEDALSMGWGPFTGPCWCNPPYSRGLQRQFITKASLERVNGITTVMLIPARTDTRAFHTYIWDAHEHRPYKGIEVRFLPGRIKFVGAAHGAPFPSMVVVFRGATA